VTGTPRAHSKYDHIFVVVRLDSEDRDDIPFEYRFSLTKAYPDYEAALREADRLNQINSDKSCRYVVHLARTVRSAT
jgi:hypothetical protein